MNSTDKGRPEPIYINCTADDPWAQMHRSGQHIACYDVRFAAMVEEDARLVLQRIWEPILRPGGLSTELNFKSIPRAGKAQTVNGYLWRQHGRDRFGSMTEEEYMTAVSLLKTPMDELERFSLNRLLTGETHGAWTRTKRYSLENGVYSETDFV